MVGGPAGLVAASFISKRGFSTVIIEKEESVGPKKIKYAITEGNIVCEILRKFDIILIKNI
jgi:flavin-dependent dehydrogenase